ncbi:hypothetical protein BVC80_1693g13 [Macleaya cordata]|uniref:Zinc finger protein n=1 Tax=Macleaya cordata TaxID=56857 RepID=A0A200PPA7_MACCD|nr:hypothetical protein BVC80_1693g13 [Macleaya cordata]
MGDRATIVNARRELEELYFGVPDESVNLTFENLVKLKQQNEVAERKKHIIEPIQKVNINEGSAFAKSPSLDFTKALQASKDHPSHMEGEGTFTSNYDGTKNVQSSKGDRYREENNPFRDHKIPNNTKRNTEMRSLESSFISDDISGIRGVSRSTFGGREGGGGGGGRRRPGIPHSNICTLCSTYIYIFRHRCLVCGRVYCRQCKNIGMGEMTEGRKCIECLGKRFSQRYIQKAGEIGCCAGYPSAVKQQELLWAEKGPRRSGDHPRGQQNPHSTSSGMMMSSSRPSRVRSPTKAYVSSSPPSFVMGSPFSPYTPNNHPIPF